MTTEHRQKLSEELPIEFDFGPSFVAGDPLDTVTVTIYKDGAVSTNISEIAANQVISGQIAQLRFNTTGGTVGQTYHVDVEGESNDGDVKILEVDIIVEAD